MKLKPLLTALAGVVFFATAPAHAQGKLNVVTTTEDLASIAREVGGDRITVEAIAKGYQDPHFVEAKPSFILKLQKADVLIVVGRELEIGWLPPLIQQSRNSKIQPGSEGYLDASLNAEILEVPTGQVTRAMGDVHPLGNPHYWLDPENARPMTAAIVTALSRSVPAERPRFEARRRQFLERLDAGLLRWRVALAAHRGARMVTMHDTWTYFAARFGLSIAATVEPTPGVPPSPAALGALIERMRAASVRVLVAEPYADPSLVRGVASRSGARAVTLIPSVGGDPEAGDYVALFDLNVTRLAAAFSAAP
jgi:zinc/manganese transport system substrate-binding protein